jgi:hypothetical protein
VTSSPRKHLIESEDWIKNHTDPFTKMILVDAKELLLLVRKKNFYQDQYEKELGKYHTDPIEKS